VCVSKGDTYFGLATVKPKYCKRNTGKGIKPKIIWGDKMASKHSLKLGLCVKQTVDDLLKSGMKRKEIIELVSKHLKKKSLKKFNKLLQERYKFLSEHGVISYEDKDDIKEYIKFYEMEVV